LDTRNTSYGFEPTAIVHSLPQAFVWAFLLFSIQGFWMTFGNLPLRILPKRNFCSGCIGFSMWRCMGSTSPTGKAFRGGSVAGARSTSDMSHRAERLVNGRRYGLETIPYRMLYWLLVIVRFNGSRCVSCVLIIATQYLGLRPEI